MANSLVQRFQEVRLEHLHWELLGADVRVLRCGVYHTPEGRVLLAGYNDGWLWHAAVAPGDAGAPTAERWRRAVLRTGAFSVRHRPEVTYPQEEDAHSTHP